MLDEPEGIITFVSRLSSVSCAQCEPALIHQSWTVGCCPLLHCAVSTGPAACGLILTVCSETCTRSTMEAVMQHSCSTPLLPCTALLHTLSTVPAYTPNPLLSVFIVSVNSVFGNKVFFVLFFACLFKRDTKTFPCVKLNEADVSNAFLSVQTEGERISAAHFINASS